MCSSTVIGFADASLINSSRARREGPLKSEHWTTHRGVQHSASSMEARIAFSQARERRTTEEGVNCRRVLRRFGRSDWRQARQQLRVGRLGILLVKIDATPKVVLARARHEARVVGDLFYSRRARCGTRHKANARREPRARRPSVTKRVSRDISSEIGAPVTKVSNK